MAIFPQQPFESQWPPQAQQQPMMGQVNPFIQGQPGAFTYSPPQLDEEAKKMALKQALFAAGMNLLASMKPTPLPQPMAANIGQAGLAGLQQYNAFEKEQFDRARDLTSGMKGTQTHGQLKGLSASNKNPVYWDNTQNMQYEIYPTGERKPYFGSLININLGDTPAEMIKSMAQLKSAREGALNLEKRIRDAAGKLTGPIEGRVRAVNASLRNDPEYARTQSEIFQLMTDILQAKSGLTVSDTEREIYTKKILPMLSKPDANALELTRSVAEWLERVYKYNNQGLSEANRISFSDLPERLGWESFEGTPTTTSAPPSKPGKSKFTLIPEGK